MSGIRTSTGLVSGIDIGGLVDSLIQVERGGARRLESRLKGIQAQQTGLTTLQAQLLSISTSVNKLQDRSTFTTLAVQNSDPSQLTVTGKATSLPGSYQFQTVALSASQRSLSRGFANADAQTVGIAGQLVISRGSELARTTKLESLNEGAGVRRGVIRITNRNGTAAEVDLRNAVSMSDVVSAINQTNLSVRAETLGGRLILRDNTAGSGPLTVQDLNGGKAAVDLGILGSTGTETLTGSEIFRVTGAFALDSLNDGNRLSQKPNLADLKVTVADGSVIDINLDQVATIDDVLGRLNTAGQANNTFSAALNDGRIVLTDLTTGTSTLTVEDVNGSNATSVLGLAAPAAGNVLTGKRLTAGLDSVLLRNLRGGQGIATPGEITLTDRTGASATIDLSLAESLDEVLAAINGAKTPGDVPLQLRAELNESRTGIVVRDTSGSTASPLVIADVGGGTTAADLGITVNAAVTTVQSGPLGLRRVNEATSLASYSPRGTAVSNGSFRITNAAGTQTVINVTSSVRTVGDVIERINSVSGLNVTATLNRTGDGIELVDNSGGSGTLTVAEVGSGRTGRDLHLVQPAVIGGDGKPRISGRQAMMIDVAATDTLNALAGKINQIGGTVRASVINTGAALNGSRLSLQSTITGAEGGFAIDEGSLNLGFATQEQARDAVLRIGGDAATGFLLTSSNNTFTNVTGNVDVTVNKVSSTAAAITTTVNQDAIQSAINTFVTAYNTYVDSVTTLTRFDTTTQVRAALQGDATTLAIQQRFSFLLNRVTGASTSTVRSLADVGVTIGQRGKLTFDANKLAEALREKPDEVRNLFTDSNHGFAVKMDQALDGLNDTITGTLTARVNALDTTAKSLQARVKQIDQQLLGRRARLEKQFTNMESTLSGLQSQQSTLTQLSNMANSLRNSNS